MTISLSKELTHILGTHGISRFLNGKLGDVIPNYSDTERGELQDFSPCDHRGDRIPKDFAHSDFQILQFKLSKLLIILSIKHNEE